MSDVTPIDVLALQSGPRVVELPGFEPGSTVRFCLRRANLRELARGGRIPNPLLPAAQRLYEGAQSTARASFAEVARVMDEVVSSAMVEPTMGQLRDAGVELTEEQFGLIWAYSQKGVAALETFRDRRGPDGADSHRPGVEDAPQRAAASGG